VRGRLAEHRLQDRDGGDAHLLAGFELSTLGLELKVRGGDHQLGLGIDEAELDLPRLADVTGAEPESRNDRERSLSWELGQREGAEAATQDVRLAVRWHHGAVSAE